MIGQWLFFAWLAVASPEEKAWAEWKKQHFAKALESPTSFLNAVSLERGLKGEILYLHVGPTPKSTLWMKKAPQKPLATAEHLGPKIRVRVKDETRGYIDPDNRRFPFSVGNGALAEVVFGRHSEKMWAYIYDPQQIKRFTGFRFYPFNPEAVATGVFKKTKPEVVSYRTVQGDQAQVRKLGNVSFSLYGKEYFLSAYNWGKATDPVDHLALVFVDETAGTETYGGGRELTVDFKAPPQDGARFVMDFNRTINFFCAHSPFWHCPTGLQQKIPVSVKAGELLPERKIVQ